MYTNEDKFFLMLITATVIVAGIVGYFLYSMVRQFRHSRALQDGYDRTRIEALEKERELIAADLHDDMGPLLSATLFKLGEVETQDERQQKLLTESIDHVNGIFSRIRSISTLLAPRAIERKGPLYALEEFSELYKHKHGIVIEIYPIPCKGLLAEQSLHLFRMLQEILHNAIRHSKANRFIVSGEIENDRLIIRTKDNGMGFEESREYQGIGLKNIKTRAEMIGAKITTITSPGAGTQYHISISLNQD